MLKGKDLSGLLAAALQFALIFLGLPAQIQALWVAKTAAGLSIGYFVLGTVGSIFWLRYGLKKHDPVMWWPQIPSVVLGSVVVALAVYYRYFCAVAPVS